jgi:hypothetical protein
MAIVAPITVRNVSNERRTIPCRCLLVGVIAVILPAADDSRSDSAFRLRALAGRLD